MIIGSARFQTTLPIRGVSVGLTLLPLLAMAMVALIGTGNLSGQASVGFNNQVNQGASVTDCSSFSFTLPNYNIAPCLTSQPTSVTITCVSPTGPVTDSFGNKYWDCVIFSGCPSYALLPLVCFRSDSNSPYITFLHKGAQAIFGSGGTNIGQASLFSSNTFFVSNDFTVILVALVALAILGSVTVFGTQFFTIESAHIVFIAGGLMALWLILTVASGFGSGLSFWGQLDASSGSILLGTDTFVILSLVFMVGILRSISRGG